MSHRRSWRGASGLMKRGDRSPPSPWHPLCWMEQRIKAWGGSRDESPTVGCDHRSRWLLHDNPHRRRGVCRVQGLVVRLGANGHRAWVRREAGVPVVNTPRPGARLRSCPKNPRHRLRVFGRCRKLHTALFGAPPASTDPPRYAYALIFASSTPSAFGRCAVHQRTSRISFTGSTFGSHPGQYKRATDSVSRRSPPIARRPRRSYGPARRSATAVSKVFVCNRSRSAPYDSVRITRSNWLR